MTFTRTVELDGHIIDSGMMQQAMGIVMDLGGDFDVEQFDVGRQKDEPSYARMLVEADDEAQLQSIVHELHQHGATVRPVDARSTPRPPTGSSPWAFTRRRTTRPTSVSTASGSRSRTWRWIAPWSSRTVTPARRNAPRNSRAAATTPRDGPRAYTNVLNGIEEGDLVVTDEAGIGPAAGAAPRRRRRVRVHAGRRLLGAPLGVAHRRGRRRAPATTKADGGNVLASPGRRSSTPAARDALAELVREGYVDMISAGNGFAAHDIERGLYGTSLGMDMERWNTPERATNTTSTPSARSSATAASRRPSRPEPSSRASCTSASTTTAVRARGLDPRRRPAAGHDHRRRRGPERNPRAGPRADMVLLLSTLLHSVAVGNCLPSTAKTVCVDINPATVTQLLDRGSSQAIGMVTDIGTFVPTLAEKVLEADDDNEQLTGSSLPVFSEWCATTGTQPTERVECGPRADC